MNDTTSTDVEVTVTTDVEVSVTPYDETRGRDLPSLRGHSFSARAPWGGEWKAYVDASGQIDAWDWTAVSCLDEARIALAVLTQAVAAAEAIRREGSA